VCPCHPQPTSSWGSVGGLCRQIPRLERDVRIEWKWSIVTSWSFGIHFTTYAIRHHAFLGSLLNRMSCAYFLLDLHCRRNDRCSSPPSFIACSWHSLSVTRPDVPCSVELAFSIGGAVLVGGVDAYQQCRPLMILYLGQPPRTSFWDRQGCFDNVALSRWLGAGSVDDGVICSLLKVWGGEGAISSNSFGRESVLNFWFDGGCAFNI
jgi:hypothetical protein